ncbi:MAG: recombinase family protein [Rhodovibrionaceae bacterium]
MQKYVSYLRVSGGKGQTANGLGIEAQRAGVAACIGDGELLQEYVEVESGKVDSRPQLRKALDHARAANAVLVCARLDRLGRRASHVLTLLDRGGAPVIFADAPNAGALELGVRAIVAEEEGRKISERTRAGLAAAKTRGTRLGNPNGAAALRRYEAEHGNKAGIEGARKAADEFAAGLRFAVERITGERITTATGIASALNEAGFPSRRGGRWHAASVQRVLRRLGIELAAKGAVTASKAA